MDMQEHKHYKTRDLAEAAALVVKEQRLVGLERDGRIFLFVFSDENPDRSEYTNQFFFGELLVNAREYHEAIVRLKNMIFGK